MNFKCKCENCKAEQEVSPVEIKIDEKAIKELTDLNTVEESKEPHISIDHYLILPLVVKVGLFFGGISKETYNRSKDNELASKLRAEVLRSRMDLTGKKKYWLCRLCKFRNNIGFDEKGRI